ncbi:hypothetical protein SAMN05421504_101627 [Amycolatopsis xylanica]|uniref:Secreted protein n=1 Tax=Amycolatopsis xylanica TaxID=589385 RepID=A0A1H2TP09_9PSEU|nr:hypothetical protein [Amycolatopsis xylanica]SDW45528.1 hypothetical protein SAMN05421504_101627 [Amycolatopsis xylanica]
MTHGRAVLACLALAALAAGCSGDPAPAPAPPPPPAPVHASLSTTPSLPPIPAETTASTAKPPKTTAPPADGTCGTVTAASGLTLQVLGGQAGGGVDCATGKKIVEQFQRKIAGKQPAESNEPVSDTVDGWLCVSGAPAAQGGTTCSKDNATVLAAVVPTE